MILYKTKQSEIVRVDGGSTGQSLKKYSTSITGDGIKTVFTIEHNLDTEDILFEINDGTEPALIDYAVVDKNNVHITFAVAPTTDEKYNIKIYGTDKNQNINDDDNLMKVPDAITDLSANVYYNHISLCFTIPANTEGLKIYISSNSNVSSISYEKFYTSKFTEDHEGERYSFGLSEPDNDYLTIDKKYYFVVYAYNSKGDSDASDIVSGTFTVPPLYIYSNKLFYTYDKWNNNIDVNYGNKFNFDHIIDCISFHKESGDVILESDIIETKNTLREIIGGSEYPDYFNYSNIGFVYSLDTDCPPELFNGIYLGTSSGDYNNSNLALIEYIGKDEQTTINMYDSNTIDINNFLSSHIDENFKIGILSLPHLSEYYFDIKIYSIYFYN